MKKTLIFIFISIIISVLTPQRLTAAPPPPTNLSYSLSNCSSSFGSDSCTVTLSWSGISSAAGYNLYYGVSSGNYTDSDDMGNVTSKRITDVPFETYYIALAAYDSSGGESAYSNELVVTVSSLSPPTQLSYSLSNCSGNSCTVTLSWSGISSAAGYNLHYSVSSGIYTDSDDMGNVTSLSFPDVPFGTFYIALTAYDSSGNKSACSDELTVTVDDDAMATIGPEGGVVEVTDPDSPIYGAKLEIPRGALTESRRITLGLANEPAALPAGYFPAGQFIEIGPDDIEFLIPATVNVPYNDENHDGFIDGAFMPECEVGVKVFYEQWVDSAICFINTSRNYVIAEINKYCTFIPSVQTNTGSSLRIMNYNTALVSFPMDEYGGTDPVTGLQISDGDRAELIAKGIKDRVRPDIVAFNEVFDDDAKESLKNVLKYDYPHYVEQLDTEYTCVFLAGNIWMDCLDSGLMLFSRFPFVPLTDHTFSAGDCIAQNNGVEWCNEVAFGDFEDVSGIDCDGWDCYAAKGAGLVRVENPANGQKFTVVFAHLQASYGSSDYTDSYYQRTARWNQMNLIRDMINTTLTLQERTAEQIYMMGDLNINGNLLSQYHQEVSLWDEWYNRFSSDFYNDSDIYKRYYACGLNPCPGSLGYSLFTDSWAYETSPDDLGRTEGSDLLFYDDPPEKREHGKRLDYILHNNPHNSICAQHLYIPWDVRDNGGKHPQSDHLPIMGDFNLPYSLCDAISARPVALASLGATDSYSGQIRYPGSIQWHKITLEGSYAIGAYAGNPSHVELDVYEDHDLSRPINPYPGKPAPHYGPKYNMPDPPYYIRVYSPDRTWTGGYNIVIHKLDCTSPGESCLLEPTIPAETFPWPLIKVNEYDTIWYTFMTDVGVEWDDFLGQNVPLYPFLKFYLTLPTGEEVSNYDNANFTLEIASTDSGDPPLPVTPDPFILKGTAEEGKKLYGEATNLDGGGSSPVESLQKEYYLKITRKQPYSFEETEIYYDTNLTYMFPVKMTCEKQDDDLGDDDAYYYMEIDGPGFAYTCASCPGWTNLGEFDNGTSLAPKTFLFNDHHKYVNHVIVNLMEYDSTTPNDYLQPLGSTPQIPSLPEEEEKEDGAVFNWANDSNMDDATYWYVFHYNLSHKPY